MCAGARGVGGVGGGGARVGGGGGARADVDALELVEDALRRLPVVEEEEGAQHAQGLHRLERRWLVLLILLALLGGAAREVDLAELLRLGEHRLLPLLLDRLDLLQCGAHVRQHLLELDRPLLDQQRAQPVQRERRRLGAAALVVLLELEAEHVRDVLRVEEREQPLCATRDGIASSVSSTKSRTRLGSRSK